MPRQSLYIFIITLLFWTAGTVDAQGTKADYERADSLGKRTSGKVFKSRIEPKWISDSNKFWYRLNVNQGEHRFILVDPDQGTRTDAFDHVKLAGLLSERLDQDVEPNRLPFHEIHVSKDGRSFHINTGGSKFEFDFATSSLVRSEKRVGVTPSLNGTTVTVLPAPRTAQSNGGATEITFINKTGGVVRIYWVNSVDNPAPYGTIKPDGRFEQHTYAGHVWLVRGEDGKNLGVYEATDEPGIAVVDGSWKPGAIAEKKQHVNKEKGGGAGQSQGKQSPDGKWIAEIQAHNVVLLNAASKEAFRLSDAGTAEDPFQNRMYWSPDSSKLIVMQEKQADKRVVTIVESSPADTLHSKLKTFNYVKPGDPLAKPRPRLFDIESKKEIPITTELFSAPWSLGEYRWSSDSSRFSFLYNQRGHQVFRLVAIDADSGKTQSIIEESPQTFVCYSSKTFYRPLEKTNEVIWMSERDGWNHLYLFDSKTGEQINQITKGHWVVRKVERVDVENRQIWFQAGGIYPDQDPYQIHYCRIDFDGTNLVKLTAGDGTHSIKYSPNGDTFIDSYSRVDLPPVTELRRTSDGTLVCELERADDSALLETGWQTPERFVAKGRDGKTDIYGVIYRPSNFDPNKKYPVIEKIYAGPHSAHVPKRFSPRGSAMAELGFIVVQIDGMGTSHRSKAFHDVCWQNIGDAGFPDRVRWIKAAAETRPYMDISRVGIFGGSAGGQNAMRALIAHNDFYQVAVADCGCHDNRMDKIWWNEQWMGFPIGEHYSDASNVDQAHRLKGKLLLIVGELDRNVDPASTMQVVDALVKADKDFDLLVIPGAGHGAAGHPYGRRRQRDFFVRHLLGVEPRN